MPSLTAWGRAIRHWKVEPRLLARAVRPDPRPNEVVYFGSWPIPRWLEQDAVAYCAGVGEEINLELKLIARFGCEVWALDPTPRAIRFIEAARPNPERFHFLPVGLWDADTTLFFQEPEDPDHVSATAVGADRGRPGFHAPVRRLGSLMRELGHTRLDLLKMNIEGAEDAVLRGMFEDGITPRCVTLTYEAPSPLAEAKRWTERMRGAGYRVIGVKGWAVTYVLD